jgi:hypothetical protein
MVVEMLSVILLPSIRVGALLTHLLDRTGRSIISWHHYVTQTTNTIGTEKTDQSITPFTRGQQLEAAVVLDKTKRRLFAKLNHARYTRCGAYVGPDQRS